MLVLGLLLTTGSHAADTPDRPYDRQVDELLGELAGGNSHQRARAIESLGYLRAYAAEDALVDRLSDTSGRVRREAALALGWCGGREAVAPLLAALDDTDWLARQAAHVALTNLTGMEFPFDALAGPDERLRQTERWRNWWSNVPTDRPPQEVLDLLGEIPAREPLVVAGVVGGPRVTPRARVIASTTYRGPPSVLTDGFIGPEYWQTKFVKPPQSCTLDLGQPTELWRVIVHQYSDQFVMVGCELAVSVDGKAFDVIERRDETTPVKLAFDFPKRSARYVRITSFGSKNPTYPTTFFEIEINHETARRRAAPRSSKAKPDYTVSWRKERSLRALGALGGEDATDVVLSVLGPTPTTSPDSRVMVRAGIRSLGRLRDEAGLNMLITLLDNPYWARCAADALGDFGDRRAVGPLIVAYPRFAKNVQGRDPSGVPRDDKMGFPSEDRMLETPYWIAYALCRLPLDDPQDLASLRQIVPLVMANLPGDHDTFMLYEPEVGHLLTRHLMETAGLRQEACEQAFLQLGQPRRVPIPADADTLAWSKFLPYRISSWLPCVCTQPEDVPRLLALLEHEQGWVRLNAAKALAWVGDEGAIEPIAKILREAKCEAEFGYSGTFKDEEYNDPAPRWREGPIRALGVLGAHQHTDLIVSILEDEGSVVEIRHAAAKALSDLGNDQALDALERAALGNPFAVVRNSARDALRGRNRDVDVTGSDAEGPKGSGVLFGQGGVDSEERLTENDSRPPPAFNGLVFIKGDNSIPNTIGTVEQADRWRQTYVVTDSGPVYRPGRNLYLLAPPRPDGKVTPLTKFDDGYVGEPELSWDGSSVLFTRRGQDDPWWQIWRVSIDGSQLDQLTRGPYHHVGPCYLPDDRIVFASTRSGIRDEYHGYPCTSLHVMNADGSDIHQIATNIGRDNEPAVLPDGRIVFSRLEVFYSRNKTELTLHAARPDGTQDVVLYGPERRVFWRGLDHGPRSPADGQEAPLTHRVLRMTQPQPMANGRGILVTTQGGLTRIGSRRDTEQIITPDNKTRSYTTPWPLPDGKILCASTPKTADRKQVDLGLYLFDPDTGQLELVYNDPATADFEPRPVRRRPRPPVLVDHVQREGYAGRFVCASVYNTQEKEVLARGRLVRLIEGMPIVGRHSTQTNEHPVWKNHGGTLARVLGTIPVAPDGSFHVEAPADRLMHFQVLDSDRRVVGQQLTWIYPRPGETKSCVGCHEDPHSATAGNDPVASHFEPVDFTPHGREFRYRAKAWFKGHLPDDIEERTRTVRAVNLLGRR